METISSDFLHDAQKLIKIELWTRRFASIILLLIFLTLFGLGGNIFSMIYDSGIFAALEGANNFWYKSNLISGNLTVFLNFVALYILLQGLSKLIRYLLTLKTLALNRYHTRKTSA